MAVDTPIAPVPVVPAAEVAKAAAPALTTLAGASTLLSALAVVKELFIAVMAFLVQGERIKRKKIEDELELMKADKRADTAKAAVQAKADSTDPGRGIDDFLSK